MNVRMNEKEWSFINEMVLNIHGVENSKQMRSEFLMLLQNMIRFDYASFYLLQDEESKDPVGTGFTDDELNSYDSKIAAIDPFRPMRSLFLDQKHSFIRVSDYVFDDMNTNEYYNVVWKPKNIRYSLFGGFGYEGRVLGFMSLFRTEDHEEFTDRDISILNVLKEHMNIRLYRDTQMSMGSLSVKDLKSEYSVTDRELEIIKLWYRGFTDNEICRELSISNNTLKKHISNIFGKLNISSRVELLKVLSSVKE